MSRTQSESIRKSLEGRIEKVIAFNKDFWKRVASKLIISGTQKLKGFDKNYDKNKSEA